MTVLLTSVGQLKMALLLHVLFCLLVVLESVWAFIATDPKTVPEEPQTRELETSEQRKPRCRCFPGDLCWPSQAEWRAFNWTIGGRLIATIPIASACHDDAFTPFSAEKCSQLQSVWGFPETHYQTPSSPMASFFANESCDPFTPRSARCLVGSYIQYAVNASSAAEYQKTLAFAQLRNIRLVIRNTGHDYYGKSTGAGALAIWTHHMKDIKFFDYRSAQYRGKAARISAGVQAFEAQAAAHSRGLVVVTGNGPTVGLAGGYTQGGGHGPLSSAFGLAADQVLEWEVVTAIGLHLVATPTQYPDLYWALSGGGGGTYGVVLSVTVKAHPDMRVAAANLTFTSQGVSQDTFFGAVETYLKTLPSLVDAGAVSIWLLTTEMFLMQPTTAPGMTKQKLQELLKPALKNLNQSGMPYGKYPTSPLGLMGLSQLLKLTHVIDLFIGEFPTYLDSYQAMNPPPNVTEFNIGGRLLPRSLVESNSSAAALTNALRFIVNNGGIVSGVSLDVSRGHNSVPNAVNPTWRSTLISAVLGT